VIAQLRASFTSVRMALTTILVYYSVMYSYDGTKYHSVDQWYSHSPMTSLPLYYTESGWSNFLMSPAILISISKIVKRCSSIFSGFLYFLNQKHHQLYSWVLKIKISFTVFLTFFHIFNKIICQVYTLSILYVAHWA